ncbi:hypothetical protein [Candidatus Vondammii sp. HM_W22]|uniref:hypothetical protein n=1 Tax=Candidatus Vondammii sp. HM_W22 TaxID=2687299 RepID=UPI001F148DC1|nr:hypothetical protein [Candidatus Vondammii sp. HM_W22]
MFAIDDQVFTMPVTAIAIIQVQQDFLDLVDYMVYVIFSGAQIGGFHGTEHLDQRILL